MNKKGIFSKVGSYLALIILALLIVVPVGWVFLASLKENSQFYGNPWTLPNGLHWENFAKAIEEANLQTFFLNSLIVTAIAIALLLVIALPAAYALSRFQFIGKKFLNILFMGGLFINVSYIVVPIFLMLNDGSKFLADIAGQKGILLNNHIILALVYASTALPFTIYLLSSYIKTLPKEFEEAAYVDGAGYTRTMIRVMLPMAKPSIITVILFNFLSFWNEYIIALTLMTKEQSKTVSVGLVKLMATQKSATQFGRMYAGLVLAMLPTLILYILVQKQLTKGMTVGGIKG